MVLIDTNELRYWPALYESPEARDDAVAHDDTWSRSLIAKLANDLGSKPYFWFEQQPTSSSLGLWSVVGPPQLAKPNRPKWAFRCMFEALWSQFYHSQRAPPGHSKTCAKAYPVIGTK